MEKLTAGTSDAEQQLIKLLKRNITELVTAQNRTRGVGPFAMDFDSGMEMDGGGGEGNAFKGGICARFIFDTNPSPILPDACTIV